MDEITSEPSRHQRTASSVLCSIFDLYHQYIRATREAAAERLRVAAGVDISMEERLERCNQAYDAFYAIAQVWRAAHDALVALTKRAGGE